MFLAAEYDERAISQAAAFLDDPQGLREVLDAIQMAASVTAVARSVTGSVLPGKTGKPARSIRFLAGSRAELPKVLGGAVVIGDGGDFVSFAGEYHLARRPASSRSRALILPGRAISVVRRESLSATVSLVVHSIPEDDWVSAEAEALLDATPGLREDLRAAMDELHAGTFQTVDAATARARIEARIKSRGSS
jgi:hypothetical protein